MIDWNSLSMWEVLPFLLFGLALIFFPTVLVPYYRLLGRLIIKPKKVEEASWEKAPLWAKYLAQDKDGIWRWHDRKPTLDADGGKWHSTSLESMNYAGYTKPVGEDYKKSLVAKPKNK